MGRGTARGRGAAALSRSTHAGAVVFKLTDQGPRYLLVEASGRRDRWVFPKGHVENGETADRKSTRLNSSHSQISYAVFCLKKQYHVNLPVSPCRFSLPGRTAGGASAPRIARRLHAQP